MRILVVSDIHGNRAAIEAIDEPRDVCFCLGDLVDYGPEPAACVRWAMANADHAVRGNHDHGVAQEVPVTGEAGFRSLTRVTRPDMWEVLSAEERHYLVRLPVTKRVTVGDVRFLLVHATPRDPLDEYLLRDEAAWARRLEHVDADVVCVGHSHMQFKLKVGEKTVLNPGSVGLPRDGDPRAAYAVIEDGLIELKRVEYPIDQTVAAVQAAPWPDRAKSMLTHVLHHGRLPREADSSEAAADDVDDGPKIHEDGTEARG